MGEEPCLPGSLFANGNSLHELFHVLITRGDTRRCTKKRSAARSCGPAIRAIESLWREERGLCVSESARAGEACVCVRARQQRYQRWYNSLNTQWQSRAVAAALYITAHISFARSLASTCVNSRKPRAPHHRPTPAGTEQPRRLAPVALWRRVRALLEPYLTIAPRPGQ